MSAIDDPARRQQIIWSLARRMVTRQVFVAFRRSDPIVWRQRQVTRIYGALQREFDNFLVHARQALVEAPAAARARREYAFADAAAVDQLRSQIAAETTSNMNAALYDAVTYPERDSVELGSGLAYRQGVAASMGVNVWH